MEWGHLFAVLHKFGFGDLFISLIRLLYNSPQANVHRNGISSDYFTGTRQGCPLSPLLFALAIEPLSIALQSIISFHGISRFNIDLKLSLYADDLLICSMSLILRQVFVKEICFLSGYKVNPLKSECYSINSLPLTLKHSDIPFKFSPSGFKYLGINVTQTLPSLYLANFSPLLTQIKSDFPRWGY